MAGESAREVARKRREKINRLTKVAENYERGAEGEEATARALTMLPAAEWTVIHDVRWPGRRFANIDHVAVGPGGVFVIDSKNWTGRVEVRDGVLRQNGYKREKEVAGAADAALAVAEVVPGLDPRLVRPVICLTSPELVGTMSREVMVCSTSTIAPTLQSHPRVLDQASARRLAGAVQFSLQNALRVPVAPRQDVARRVRRPHVSRSPFGALLRRLWRLLLGLSVMGVALVVGAMLVMLGLALLLGLFSRAGGEIADGLTRERGGTTAVSEQTLGAAQRLPRATGRPPLVVTADRIVTTEATGDAPFLFEGNRFVAVRVTVRNVGKRTWRSQPGTEWALINEHNVPARATGGIPTKAGRPLPPDLKLSPGGRTRGWVVFQMGITKPAVRLDLTVGPGQPASASWVIDRQ